MNYVVSIRRNHKRMIWFLIVLCVLYVLIPNLSFNDADKSVILSKINFEDMRNIKGGASVIGVVCAVIGTVAITVGTVVSYTKNSKGQVTETVTKRTVSGGFMSANVNELSLSDKGTYYDGLICAAMVRQSLGIDSQLSFVSNYDDFVNNMASNLKMGKCGEKLDVKANGGLFYLPNSNLRSSVDYKAMFDKTSSMWNSVLTIDDGTAMFNSKSRGKYSFEMVPLGSANADEIITDMIVNKNCPVIALVDIATVNNGVTNIGSTSDFRYCVIYGIIESSNKSVKKRYMVMIPSISTYSNEYNVSDFVEKYVVIDPKGSNGTRIKNWDYNKYGCWYTNYNTQNFYFKKDLSNGQRGYLGYGTTSPGYFIMLKTGGNK